MCLRLKVPKNINIESISSGMASQEGVVEIMSANRSKECPVLSYHLCLLSAASIALISSFKRGTDISWLFSSSVNNADH